MGWTKNKIPQQGDLLRVRRVYGYFHYGIALSDSEVIHFSGPVDDEVMNADNIKIRRAPMSLFKKDDVIEVRDSYDSIYSRSEVVSRAKEFVNSSIFRGKNYDFLLNNCEHFARYCYYGNPQSVQVGRALSSVILKTVALSSKLKKSKTTNKENTNVIEVDSIDTNED